MLMYYISLFKNTLFSKCFVNKLAAIYLLNITNTILNAYNGIS